MTSDAGPQSQAFWATPSRSDGALVGDAATLGGRSLSGVTHESERSEPLVPLVVVGLEASDGILCRLCQVDPDSPAYVLAKLELAAGRGGFCLVQAHPLVEQRFSGQSDHALDALLRHPGDRATARDCLPDLDGLMNRSRNDRHILEWVAAEVDLGGNLVTLAVVGERPPRTP
jgi:hypothetical protein